MKKKLPKVEFEHTAFIFWALRASSCITEKFKLGKLQMKSPITLHLANTPFWLGYDINLAVHVFENCKCSRATYELISILWENFKLQIQWFLLLSNDLISYSPPFQFEKRYLWDRTGPPPEGSTPDVCVMPEKDACEFTNGVCFRDATGSCRWKVLQPCKRKKTS